ncbi:hypothetical protein HBH82_177220 [Parastagonospora nodorum]|nr:hypothetical protein HBH82_177220 [Parastagonospora nodorum]KAH4677917.1 hypothetical protein HBH78_147670 [Parastagonospora nodorum]KAH4699856.1 hypothetical protein HBH67_152120 [Parastagonospora nodorum]KAH4769385.1 hypothetical protein HBH63_159040 [Parastagonospora nodorum]KAH4776183.1 hypothetical protein HBH62_169850 [Parastagonospora nodorum]
MNGSVNKSPDPRTMAAENTLDSSAATDPGESTPTTFHGRSRLPAQLKLEILSHHVPVAQEITWSNHREQLRPTLSKIFQTCNRELVTLCLDIYYSMNTFLASCLRPKSRKFDTSRPPTYGYLIRSLETRFYISWDPSIASYTTSPFLRLLFHDQKYTGTHSSLTWQENFPNLKELKLIIVFISNGKIYWKDECSSCWFVPAHYDGLRNWLKTTEIRLKGQNVTVRLVFNSRCDCQCGKSTELLIKNMATRNNSV